MEVLQQQDQIKRCGECSFSYDRTNFKFGTWKTGTREKIRCGYPDNSYLPDSVRFGKNFMSTRHFACEYFKECLNDTE